MNELLVVFYILATLAVAYLVIYPRYVGNNVKLMMWLDVPITAVPLGISALLFWVSDPKFNLFGIELNWFIFTLVTMLLIELPIFLLYLKARGLSQAYWAQFSPAPKGSPDAGWASASVKSVEKQLNDTKWDGLRTPAARRLLLWSSNLMMLGGTGFLFAVGDNGWASYALIHILLIFVFWFLLRQSVRLVADAPEEALDEMLIQLRDRSYLVAYRWLAVLIFIAGSALLVYSIFYDSQPDSDGFNYLLNFTWPQVQAIFWFFAGYGFMMPSMALLSVELKRTKSKRN